MVVSALVDERARKKKPQRHATVTDGPAHLLLVLLFMERLLLIQVNFLSFRNPLISN